MKKIEKATNILVQLKYKYNFKYIDSRYQFEYFNIFKNIETYGLSVDDIIDIFEDQEIHVILHTCDYNRLYISESL